MDNKPKKGKEFNSLLAASSIGLVFVISIVLGSMAGWWLDGKFGTKPYLTIFLMILGIIAGFQNMWRFIKKANIFDDKEEP